jgi:hypothetical protein
VALIDRLENRDQDLRAAIHTFAATETTRACSQVAACQCCVTLTFTGFSNTRCKTDFNEYRWRQIFALLPSTRNSWWLLPIGNKACSLAGSQIYMPYSWRARSMKKLLLAAIRLTPDTWARHKVVVASTQPLLLQQLVTRLTGEADPVFSLLVGTPSPFRKLIIQVMRPNGDILGYIKLPLSRAASACVLREAATLRKLSLFPSLRPNIPQLIYSGEWQGGHILFESPGPVRSGPITFGPPHQRFLKSLRNIHVAEKAGSDLVNETAVRWCKIEATVHPSLRELGERSLTCADHELSGATVHCGIMHGDFAPWNTRITDENELFVFDWEFSVWEAPTSWDVFHFRRQTARHLKKPTRMNVLGAGPAERASFLLYILDSICTSYESGGPSLARLEGWRTTLREQLS